MMRLAWKSRAHFNQCSRYSEHRVGRAMAVRSMTRISGLHSSKIFKVIPRFQAYSTPFTQQAMMFSSYPKHTVVPMPALSPTMESGSIANWALKEGDGFEPGMAICEVETDKATVTYEATDDGFIAKILVGSGELKVGEPMMITVEEESNVPAFANYTVADVISCDSSSTSVSESSASSAAPVIAPEASFASSSGPTGASMYSDERVFASPYARALARDNRLDLTTLSSSSTTSGPDSRIIAPDMEKSIGAGVAKSTISNELFAQPATSPSPVSTTGTSAESLITMFAHSKKVVPHYFLSVEINLTKLMTLRDQLNMGEDHEISVQDFLVKAAAKAMTTVPVINSHWMDSFIRRYDQVDINVMVGGGSNIRAPVLKGAESMGLTRIAHELSAFESNADDRLEMGTFSVHNLGVFGVKSAAPIVLTPQACALSLGTVVDAVIPNPMAEEEGQENWTIAPVMVTTLSCDHRVVDGAVGAEWLQAFKEYAQNPITLLL